MSGKMVMLLAARLSGKPTTEAPIQAGILKGLRKLGIWCFRTGRYKRRGPTDHAPESGEDGMPDIWTPFGWVETKAPKGKLNPDQVKWHAKARQHGINVHTASSVVDGVKTVLGWRAARGRVEAE